MNYAIEMDSVAIIYIPHFIKIGSGIQKLMGGYTGTKTARNASLILFLQNKESRLVTRTRRDIMLKAQFRTSFKAFKHPRSCLLLYDVQYTCDVLLEALQILSAWNCEDSVS
jgi:hypothetical protein